MFHSTSYGYSRNTASRVGLRARTDNLPNGIEVGQWPRLVTNAFNGKPQEPCSLTGWKAAPLKNRPLLPPEKQPQ